MTSWLLNKKKAKEDLNKGREKGDVVKAIDHQTLFRSRLKNSQDKL